ncbi:MAG: S1/P1 Nuclease [Paraburkholderia sp.]|nr:MAG: S1/P1 Nuclease [Paraburkholderia sp.]
MTAPESRPQAVPTKSSDPGLQSCHRVRHWLACGALLLSIAPSAFAWGDGGHRIVAKIADHYLTSSTRAAVNAMLANDSTGLTATDMASAASWADRYRNKHPETANWHFVDTEISDGDIDAACFGHPPLPLNTPASAGPATACVVDKVDQFTKELAAPQTTDAERLLALQFLLHFVGDLHQPLHASDSSDRGGNDKLVSAPGIAPGKLHSYWDTAFVKRLGSDTNTVASQLIGNITCDQAAIWQTRTPRDWSLEAFDIAKQDVYGKLPAPNSSGTYALSDDYVSTAQQDVALQLSRAGVRLAMVLNGANLKMLGATSPPGSTNPPGSTSPPGDGVLVWVNTKTGVYHCPGSAYYGNTQQGVYMYEDQAKAGGYRPAGGKTCSA